MHRYALNTVALPVCLLGLVVVTWWSETGDANTDSDTEDELKAHKREDFYFAFFLCCTLPIVANAHCEHA